MNTEEKKDVLNVVFAIVKSIVWFVLGIIIFAAASKCEGSNLNIGATYVLGCGVVINAYDALTKARLGLIFKDIEKKMKKD